MGHRPPGVVDHVGPVSALHPDLHTASTEIGFRDEGNEI